MVAKVILVGDTGVGKTTILSYSIHQKLVNLQSTVGANFWCKSVNLDDKIVKLHIWDTAGQERFRSIVKLYYSNANACVCVFDLTNYTSFKSLTFWINEYIDTSKNNNILIVANKSDLPTSKWEVTIEDIKKISAKHNCEYLFTECITGTNIEAIFEKIGKLTDKFYPIDNITEIKPQPIPKDTCGC